VVVAAYVYAAIEPLARSDALTLAIAGAVALTATWTFLRSSGPARKAAGVALVAALAFAAVLATGAIVRMLGHDWDRTLLLTYDAVVAFTAIVLVVDLVRSRWTDAVVTGLVVDLGEEGEPETLRDKLAHALGDPTLALGYSLHGTDAFVDDAGLRIELPAAGSGRAVTPIEDGGEQIAVLVHDDSLLADRELVDAVAAAARIAVGNARLRAQAQTHALELEASRRRLVETGDAQRRRLERELRLGAESRLATVAAFLEDAETMVATADAERIAVLEAELDEARRELREFGHGVHPAALEENGLMPALERLVQRSAIPIEVAGAVERLPEPIEAAIFFVVSEGLANAAKHSSCSRVLIELRQEHASAAVTIADDGVGGADPARGSGLVGLVDRIEALGGSIHVHSAPGEGTRVIAEIPLPAAGGGGDERLP
jgi:signal transduction histidine kinase